MTIVAEQCLPAERKKPGGERGRGGERGGERGRSCRACLTD